MQFCVVFDLDGTLIDSAPHVARIASDMLAARGDRTGVTEAQVRPYVTTGVHRLFVELLEGRCGDVDAAVAEFRARYAALPTPPASLFPGAREALSELASAGLSLGVWSNKLQTLCDKVIGELGLDALVDAVVGAGPAVPLKPDLTGLDLVLARVGAARSRCCYVGDSEPDHAAATAAGVPLVMMTHGYGDFSRAWPDAVMCDTFRRLPSIVETLLPERAAA
jgi:phosphoglycolate phosphatase